MRKAIQVICNIYWEQSAYMGIENDFNKYTGIERWIRKACVSHWIYWTYTKSLTELDDLLVLINNIRFADDSVSKRNSERKLKLLLDKIIIKSKTKRDRPKMWVYVLWML